MNHIVQHMVHDRHFWRKMKFGELSELYISMSLKSMALSLVALFIPIYLYQLGYLLIEIALFYVLYFLIRTPLHFVSAFLTARFGPKHVIGVSYLALLLSLIILYTLPEYGWSLWLVALTMAIFNSLFFIGFHVDFSKVRDENHAGKQLSTMSILVRAAAALGPFIGGLIASRYGIHVTLLLAIVLIIIAIVPLMLTKEPITPQKKIDFNLNFTENWHNLLALVLDSIARQSTLVVWPLFLTIYVFENSPYASIGFVVSISIALSLFATKYFGRLIDRHKSRVLLKSAWWIGAIVNSLRVFANNLGTVTFVNVSMETAESAQLLTVSKGFYGEADNAKDRIGYIAIAETFMSIARSVLWLVIFVAFIYLEAKVVFILMFLVSSIASIGVLTERFKTLE